ncbi:MAG: Mg2+/Co2+ transporter [Desulfobacteraceae bacterium]|nr:MAG: Mg2+/Co2+ transporter [Desulfobacteraceae bacterium]
MSESRFFHISHAGKLLRVDSLAEALSLVKKGGYLWLDYFKPTKEDLSALIEPLGIHPLAIEDCLDQSQIPKIEDFPQNTFIIFNAFRCVDGRLAIDEVDAFLGAHFLITVSGNGSGHQWHPGDIEQMIEKDMGTDRQGPAFLLHTLLDYIVDQKFLAIEALEEALDAAEDALLADVARFNPAELLGLRRDLLALRKSLFHEREILVKICRKDSPFVPEKAIYFYRDIYDHLAKFFELTESYRDLVTSLMEMYLSMLNNQMALVANETNATVRRLTFITTIFMPLTLLAGIGGMSEWSMMTGPANWRVSYPLFLLGMGVIGFVSYYVLKRLGKKKNR